MTETLDAYVTRQAATVGVRPPEVGRSGWVPQFPGANGRYLGMLQLNPPTPDYVPADVFSDGLRMVTGHDDGFVRAWDLTTGEQLWISNEGHQERITDIRVSKDGRLVASASRDRTVRIWNSSDGKCLVRCEGHTATVMRVSWSPDGSQVASAPFSEIDRKIRIWDAITGTCVKECEAPNGNVQGLDWSPDGRIVASGDNNGTISFWDPTTGDRVFSARPTGSTIWGLSWSPDSQLILVGYTSSPTIVLQATTGHVWLRCENIPRWNKICGWSPDGSLFAIRTNSEDQCTIHIRDAQTDQEVESFQSEVGTGGFRWSSAGSYIVSGIQGGSVCFWDTRHLVRGPSGSVGANFASSPAPWQTILPVALAYLHRLGLYPPLSFVRDLLDLTGGHPVQGPIGTLAQDSTTGLPGLIALRWPTPARIGLVALLLHSIQPSGWQPPPGISPPQMRAALSVAMYGEAIPPVAPPLPLPRLQAAAQQVDAQLITLLTLLGPEAVAADPGLPLRLLSRVPRLPALSDRQRRLLSMQVRFAEQGAKASGRSLGADHVLVGGVESGRLRTDWGALLPSQLAFDEQVLAYRYQRGELLFRAREVAEPPKLRPTVLLLDVSPPTFGPVEAVTRLAAYIVGRTLQAAGVPVVLVTFGDQSEQILPLERTADLVEIWTARTLQPINAGHCLRVASAVRASLPEGSGREPIILLLTQPWFGAEAEVRPITGLRALFVQYPGQSVLPALAGRCDRWQNIVSGQVTGLAQILGHLLG